MSTHKKDVLKKYRNISIVSLIALSAIGSGVAASASVNNNEGTKEYCVTAKWADDNSILSEECVYTYDSTGGSEAETPGDETPAVIDQGCDDIKMIASEGVNLDCKYNHDNAREDMITVVVSTESETPIEWSVSVDANREKGFKTAKVHSQQDVFGKEKELVTPVFEVYGKEPTDSWIKQHPENNFNHKFIHKGKDIEFKIRLKWGD